MYAEKFYGYSDSHTVAFVSLLLRKGYHAPFEIRLDGMAPHRGMLESCMDWLLAHKGLPAGEVRFLLATFEEIGHQVHRNCCILDVVYNVQDGYLIHSLTYTSAQSSPARVITLTRNEDLPFLRLVREGKVGMGAWPARLNQVLSFFNVKFF